MVCPQAAAARSPSRPLFIDPGELPFMLDSAAGAACNTFMSRKTETAAPVNLYGQSTPAGMPRVSSDGGVAGRLFGQVRCDLLLQISPSVSGRRACYVLRL